MNEIGDPLSWAWRLPLCLLGVTLMLFWIWAGFITWWGWGAIMMLSGIFLIVLSVTMFHVEQSKGWSEHDS